MKKINTETKIFKDFVKEIKKEKNFIVYLDNEINITKTMVNSISEGIKLIQEFEEEYKKILPYSHGWIEVKNKEYPVKMKQEIFENLSKEEREIAIYFNDNL